MKKVGITVVTVTYNCSNIIEKTLQSVLLQNYSWIEYIVIDGFSSDGTKEIIEKYKDRISIYISEPDLGIYDAMNKGIRLAKSEWILFLNSGDVFVNDNTVSELFMNNFEGYDVVYGNHINVTQKGDVLFYPQMPFFKNKKWYHGMGFSHQAVMIRTELAKKYEFNLDFPCCADYNMMYNLYNDGFLFQYVNVVFSKVYAIDGYSMNNYVKQRKDIARILGIDGSIKFFLYDRFYRIAHLLRVGIKSIFIK